MKKRKLIVLLCALTLMLAGCTQAADPVETPVVKEETPVVEEVVEAEPIEEVVDPALEPRTSYEPVKMEVGSEYAVSSSRIEATEMGMNVLADGGNAVDAAVATHFGIMFFEEESTGLGGGGFTTIYLAEEEKYVFVDGRETAGEYATPDMYVNLDMERSDLYRHPLISGVPGNVMSMEVALENYGTMSLQTILEDYVIPEAERGIYVSSKLATNLAGSSYPYLLEYEESAAIWVNDGLPYLEGETIYNQDLVDTYKLIAKEGSKVFYEGEIAEDIVATHEKYGGILTMNDLASYEADIIEPISGTYRGYEIISSPPPSSGGTIMIEALNILESFEVGAIEHNSAEHIQLLYNVAKQVYSDRALYMGDTAFVDVPLEGLTSKEYGKEIADQITLGENSEFEIYNPFEYESQSTTHLSVVDGDGNIVAITSSVNGGMGTALTVQNRGFLLNNELGDFNTSDPTSVNAPEPGKKPLSSMSPTIVVKDGKPVMAIGTPGGSTILYSVAQVISNVIDYDMTLEEAVNIPRISYSLSADRISIEEEIGEEVFTELEAMGIIVKTTTAVGAVNGVALEDDVIYSVADPRRPGHAMAE